MLSFPKELSKARILISNDDGIHSQGIKVLEEIALGVTDNVWVVAPETEQSAAGHSLTIHRPLRMRTYDDRHISVFGTPTDSVLMAVKKVMEGRRPDLILSGINHGKNNGDDVTYSGTIAVAIEATLLGIPAIAFSQDHPENRQSSMDWDIAKKWIPKILSSLEGFEWEDNVLLNVNFPAVDPGADASIKVVPQGHFNTSEDDLIECIDPRGKPYFWIGPPPEVVGQDETTDIGAVADGHITITPLSLNLTHDKTLDKLKGIIK